MNKFIQFFYRYKKLIILVLSLKIFLLVTILLGKTFITPNFDPKAYSAFGSMAKEGTKSLAAVNLKT